MLHRIIGRAGCGKTTYLLTVLREALENGADCVVLVPEQQSLETERLLSETLGDGYNMHCEVLNFERLPNRVAREYGDLARTFIDDSGRDLLLSVVLERLSPRLTEYGGVCADGDFIRKALSAIAAFKAAGVDADALDAAADRLRGSSARLAAKLSDLSLILRAYGDAFPEGLSDTYDALTQLAAELPDKPFFAGKFVFVDGFYNFTGQEHAILDVLIPQSAETYIAFTADGGDDSGIFSKNQAAAARLAAANRPFADVILNDNYRARSAALRHLEARLWSEPSPVFPGEPAGVSVVECPDPFAQAEAVCNEVLRRVRAGSRYRDIAVTMRAPDGQSELIASMLEIHGVPAFVSVKKPVVTEPFFSFLLASLDIVCTDFSVPSVKKYIKSGFSGLGVRESDLLLRYVSMWSLRGRRSYETDWTMHPDGYRTGLNRRDASVLRLVNGARAQVCEALTALCEDFAADGLTVSRALRALFRHVESSGAPARLAAQAEALRSRGEEEAALRLSQLWDLFVGLCDQFHTVCPDAPVTPARFRELFRLAAEEKSVGTIPASLDAVTVGSAELLRAGNVRHLLVTDVNDGVFPAPPSDRSLFDSDELVALEGCGCAVGESADEQIETERFLFYAVASLPSESLTLLYTNTDSLGARLRPSIGVLRVEALFPALQRRVFGRNPADLLFSRRSVAERLRLLPDPAPIRALLAEQGMPPLPDGPISDPAAALSGAGNIVRLTPSRMDTYTYCPFSYFGRYVLGLKSSEKASFARPEIGTFVHALLETFVQSRMQAGAFVPPTAEEIDAEVERLTADYLAGLSAAPESAGRRFRYTFTKLKKTMKLLLQNLSDELENCAFVPAAFELKMGMGEDAEGLRYTTDAGTTVTLSGIADRVDLYKKGGKTYVRVIDYKTGTKVFDRSALENGLDLQMFYYLFAYCRADRSGSTLPAGVLYVPAKLPQFSVSGGESEEELARRTEKGFVRSGLLLADAEIVRAMDPAGEGRFLPARFKKDGSFYSGSSVAELEQLGKLERQMERYIRQIGDRIAAGEMRVSPLVLDDNHNACTFCDMKPVCRLACNKRIRRESNRFGEEDE